MLDPGLMALRWRYIRKFRALDRERRRKLAEAERVARGLPPPPGWIDADPPGWCFPSFAMWSRPFDWEIDA